MTDGETRLRADLAAVITDPVQLDAVIAVLVAEDSILLTQGQALSTQKIGDSGDNGSYHIFQVYTESF